MICTFVLWSSLFCYAQTITHVDVANENPISSESNNETETALDYCLLPEDPFPTENVRALDEINIPDEADAYPWISEDGLRLYFTQDQSFFMAERPDDESLFETPQLLSFNSSVFDNISLWLTQDELKVYFITRESNAGMGTSLFVAERVSMDEDFGAPQQIQLLGDLNGFFSSPSLTINEEELYLYNASTSSGNRILVFSKTGDFEYTQNDVLEIPIGSGCTPAPGRLAKSDLAFFIPLETFAGGFSVQNIVYYERDAVGEPFSPSMSIENTSYNDPSFFNIQPHVTNNMEYSVFVRSNENNWNNNDLYIAKLIPTSTSLLEPGEQGIVNAYPNPTLGIVNFDLPEGIKSSQPLVRFYTPSGKLVAQVNLSSKSNIDLNNYKLPSGVYYYEIVSESGNPIPGKIVLR